MHVLAHKLHVLHRHVLHLERRSLRCWQSGQRLLLVEQQTTLKPQVTQARTMLPRCVCGKQFLPQQTHKLTMALVHVQGWLEVQLTQAVVSTGLFWLQQMTSTCSDTRQWFFEVERAQRAV